MRQLFPIGLILILAYPVSAGDVDGKVWITRRLIREAVAPTVYNLRGVATPAVPELDTVTELDRTVVVPAGRNLKPAPPRTITVEQKNSRFAPDLAIVPVGSNVEFPNLDPIFHNVFSLAKTQQFDLGFYPKGQSRTVTLGRPGVVQVYCHIHANLYAAIVVTDSPCDTKPGADGGLAFAHIPAGHYEATAWHKIAGLYSAAVDVPETVCAEVRIRVPVDMERR